MPIPQIDTDYLVIGSGTAGLAFADTLVTFAEHLGGCVEAKRLARPLVQLSRDRVELKL